MSEPQKVSQVVRPVVVVISDEAIAVLEKLTSDKWESLSPGAQAAMTNMLAERGWDFTAIIGGSLMTQILAMASVDLDGVVKAAPEPPKPTSGLILPSS